MTQSASHCWAEATSIVQKSLSHSSRMRHHMPYDVRYDVRHDVHYDMRYDCALCCAS